MLTLLCSVIGDMQGTCNVIYWKSCTVIWIGTRYVMNSTWWWQSLVKHGEMTVTLDCKCVMVV